MSDKTHPIADQEFSGANLDEMQIFPVESYEVCEWTPQRDGQGKPEQVHILFDVGPYKLAIRLKSAGECDRLIGVLTRHRLGVWPKREE